MRHNNYRRLPTFSCSPTRGWTYDLSTRFYCVFPCLFFTAETQRTQRRVISIQWSVISIQYLMLNIHWLLITLRSLCLCGEFILLEFHWSARLIWDQNTWGNSLVFHMDSRLTTGTIWIAGRTGIVGVLFVEWLQRTVDPFVLENLRGVLDLRPGRLFPPTHSLFYLHMGLSSHIIFV